jgi:hypothetical protein
MVEHYVEQVADRNHLVLGCVSARILAAEKALPRKKPVFARLFSRRN